MKLLFEKRKFKKSLFFAKIFIFKLFFHEKCPELGKLQYLLKMKVFNRENHAFLLIIPIKHLIGI